ncbi:MAG: GDP-mannose 4,6-dehydratase [Anaerolineae bacterium]|nr:GDP-mannose 4,6-dehydratase [Anaerolineae bacterium]
MRVLITGADGFAGRHLIHELASDSGTPSSYELHGTSFRPFELPGAAVTYHTVDLRDEKAVADLIGALQPDHIYHLAAQASPARSYSAVWSTLENNIHAQVSVILGCLIHNLKPRILVVSSGDIYGEQTDDRPATEDLPLRPSNPDRVSKAAQDMLAVQYYLSNNLPIMRARPFNHLGPGQSPGFVAPDFALQIARIEAGQQPPTIRVGSLSAERDFTDVRDVVRGYRLIMERGAPGEVYNIASGRTWTIRAVLDMMLALTDAHIRIESDTARLRPGGTSKVWGDASRLREATGWQPIIPLEQTVRDVLDDCRQRVRALTGESK